MSEQDKDLFIEEWEEENKPSKEDRVLGAVCYAHFLFLAPFFMQKDTDFLKFHMKQWWVLYVLFLLINLVCILILPFSISFRLVGLTWLAYTWIWVFVWYKAYLWIRYELWFLSWLVDLVSQKLNENNK